MLLTAFSLVINTVLLQSSRNAKECNDCASKSSSPSSHSMLHKPILLLVKDLKSFLTFICACIASVSLKYNQQDASFSQSIYFYKLLYMFQAVPLPIISSTKLYIQRQVL